MNNEIITLKDGKTIRLSELFIECNNLYFNGNLRRPFMCTFMGRRGSGCSLANCSRNKKGRLISLFIGIACNIEWTEENLRKVLLREMAYLYTMCNATKSIRKYGKEFKALIEELNSKYGLGLSAEEYSFDLSYELKPHNPLRRFFNLFKRYWK